MARLEDIIKNPSNSVGAILAKAGLWCASQPYAAAVWMRNWAFDRGLKKSTRVAVPVISVGNLTAGGTGKTPMVAFLARWFRNRDVRVAILSRGYGAGADGRNDEAKELENSLPDVPHLQSPDRVASAAIAIEELDMQVLVLDDGFQHRKIDRDLNIVLLDSREPFGFGHLLPRGLLREPLRSLKRADIVVATRSDQVETQKLAAIRTKVQRHNPKAAWVEARHAPIRLRNAEGHVLDCSDLSGKRVVAICGIGNPQAFIQTVQMLGATVLDQLLFPDHHAFQASDIRAIGEFAASSSDCDYLVCTGKDLAKIELSHIGHLPIWSLDVELQITSGIDVLEDRLKEILRHDSVRVSR